MSKENPTLAEQDAYVRAQRKAVQHLTSAEREAILYQAKDLVRWGIENGLVHKAPLTCQSTSVLLKAQWAEGFSKTAQARIEHIIKTKL